MDPLSHPRCILISVAVDLGGVRRYAIENVMEIIVTEKANTMTNTWERQRRQTKTRMSENEE